jgi:rhodanese-related sulfurtransferase
MEPSDVPLDGSIQIVDVRTPVEWQAGHIEGSLHVPLAELPERAEEIDVAPTTVVVCQIGQRSYMAAMYLRGLGIDAHNLDGGLERWVSEGRPLVTNHEPGRVIDGMGQILEG